MQSTLQLTGIGLRAPHYHALLTEQPPIAWVEVHSENYFGEGGKSLHWLDQVRTHYPISLHGVGLSLGSTDELNWQHLKRLRELATRIEPCLISDHLCFSSIEGQYLHDLLPLPQTHEVVQHVVARIQQVQDYLKRPLLIENIAAYVNYAYADLSEAEFITEIATQAGCGILLDVSNIYINSINFGFNPSHYLHHIPAHLVQEIHLGGFTTSLIAEHEILIDTHNKPIVPAVWELFRETILRLGNKPVIIEWDKDLPDLNTLCLEAYRAEKIMRDNHATKLTG
jgi:uncharacterized protein (UPF0276 family)